MGLAIEIDGVTARQRKNGSCELLFPGSPEQIVKRLRDVADALSATYFVGTAIGEVDYPLPE